MRLTALQIDRLPIPEKGQKTYWDGGGLGVRVSQGGSKSFVLMHGEDRRLRNIGRYPSMSLKTARREAQQLKLASDTFVPIISVTEALSAFLDDTATRARQSTVDAYNFRLKHLTGRLDKVEASSVPPAPQSQMALNGRVAESPDATERLHTVIDGVCEEIAA